MNHKEKCLHIMVAVGTLEAVRADEEDIKPKSANALMLKNLIDHCVRVGERYGMNEFIDSNCQQSIEVLTYIENKVRQTFAPKRVGRDDKGRFITLGGE